MVKEKNTQTILIADDLEINRALLSDMLGSEFEILEAEDGAEAVGILQNRGSDIDLVLLDIVMPKMDGFEVLAVMNRSGWIKDIPVIMISSETSSSYIERAYELGVTEFINRPFDAWIVRRRVMNTLMLSGKSKKLVGLVTDQIYEREKMNNLMITILSHIVEFRNGESGLHVLHIRTIVDLLLRDLVLKTDKYKLTPTDLSLIATASALHDIGKIGIPDGIINKPGKLTDEEFAVMKTHTTIGAQMLGSLDFIKDEKLIRYSLEICRHHHERYDGRGYPDRLAGEDIPISAQVVSVADVYDALTSERVYKKAFSPEKALEMIINGECGKFNPILLECLQDCAPRLIEELRVNSPGQSPYDKIQRVTDEIMQHEELSTSARTLTLLENERIKNRFYAEISKEVQFEYVYDSSTLMIFDFGEKKIGLDEITVNPLQDEKVRAIYDSEKQRIFKEAIEKTTPENYSFSLDTDITADGETRWMRVNGRAMFSMDTGERTGVIGKLVDITKEVAAITALRHKATHDQLTLLYNGETARAKIIDRLGENPRREYVMLMIDLDYFKNINDTYGHEFGNQVLKHIANTLMAGLRREDIIARFGGDEFLVLFEGHPAQDATIERIFESLVQPFNNLPMSVSMGVADTITCGRDFETLFNCADRAAYEAKRSGKKAYRRFEASLTDEFPTISAIDEPQVGTDIIRLPGRDGLKVLLQELKRLFADVRILDVDKKIKYCVNDDGTFTDAVKDDDYHGARIHGVVERAVATKRHASAVVFRGNSLYKESAFFLESGFNYYVLEIITEIEDAELKGMTLDKSQLIGMIDRMDGEKMYADSGTGAYNMRFYDDQIGDVTDFYSVLVVRADGGETDCDNMLDKDIVDTILANVRVTDAVIHGDGRKFAVILKKLTAKRFEEILKHVGGKLKTSHPQSGIGAVRALGKVRDIIDKADTLAEKAVRDGKTVLYEKEKKTTVNKKENRK